MQLQRFSPNNNFSADLSGSLGFVAFVPRCTRALQVSLGAVRSVIISTEW
jgi:hypothetical protein